jgi:hypothetical protein
MAWDCTQRGCFNKKRRPKIEQFAECLPGKIAFSDVDAITEIQGRALVLEWKADPSAIPLGQSLMWRRLTKTGDITVLCIAGDAENMDISHVRWCYKGTWDSAWQSADMQRVKDMIRAWVAEVSGR